MGEAAEAGVRVQPMRRGLRFKAILLGAWLVKVGLCAAWWANGSPFRPIPAGLLFYSSPGIARLLAASSVPVARLAKDDSTAG